VAAEDIVRALRDTASGFGRAGLSIGSGMLATPIAGLEGLVNLGLYQDPARAAEHVKRRQQELTLAPDHDIAERGLQNIAGAVDTAKDAALATKPGQYWQDVSMRNPLAAALLTGAVEGTIGPKGGKGKLKVPETPVGEALREVPLWEAPRVTEIPSVAPKVTARGPDLNTPEGIAAFEQKYGRKPVHLMTEPERVQHFGPAMAESPDYFLTDPVSGRKINLPGGPEGNLTLADQAKISAQAIDYSDINPKLAQTIHEKLVRSVDPGANPSDLELANRLQFGVTSGNAPITKNLVEHAQMRPRSEADMAEWASWSPGLNRIIPPEARNTLNRAINEAFGVQAGERGGTGVANTANRQFVADLHKMMLERPDFFRRAVNETEGQYVERLMNQVRGLGPKTGSLGFAMIEPQTSNISAIDRHIADLTREAVKANPATRPIFEQQMLNALNLEQPASKRAASYSTALRRMSPEEAAAVEAEKFRDIVSTPTATVYRRARTGDINPNVPEHLRQLPFYEPARSQQIGPLYQAALSEIQKGGAERGIGGFSNQWLDWDYKRSRAEPHAALNPMATEMPRLTPEEYAQVQNTFSKAGAFETKPDPKTGKLKPLKPTADFRKLIYGNADPALVAAIAAGAATAPFWADALRRPGAQ